MTNQYNLDSNNYFGKMNQGLMPTFPVNNAMQQFASDIRRIPNRTLAQDQFMLQNQKPQKKKGNLGKKVAYVMGALGILTIALNKGASGKISKAISNWAHKIEMNRLAEIAKNGGGLSNIDRAVSHVGRITRRVSNFGQSAANFTAAKDTVATEFFSWKWFGFFDKSPKLKKVQGWLQEHLPLQKGFDWCSRHIYGITEKSVKAKFMRANQAFDELFTILRKNGVAETEIAGLEKRVRDIFSDASRTGRWNEAIGKLRNIGETVKGNLKWKNLSSYVTEEAVKPGMEVLNKASGNFEQITCNITDICKSSREIAHNLLGQIKPDDIASRRLLGSLEEAIGALEKADGGSREKAKEAISGILTQLKNNITRSDNTLYGTNKQPIVEFIENIENQVGKPKGKLENILTGLTGDAKKEAGRAISNARAAAQEALGAEQAALSRYGEVKVGAITTDVLSIGATAAAGGIAIAHGKDKDEKVGASLKVALPLLGTIGTYFYTTAKGMSGFKNLALALITGFVLNKFGSFVNDSYQKSANEKKTWMQIAQNAYNNATAV